MGTWNMAGLRHRQTPRRYVKVAPVVGKVEPGRQHHLEHAVAVCFGCGYHVCSCVKKPLQCGLHTSPLASCLVCYAIAVANRASMRMPTEGQRGTASVAPQQVGILALCLECTGKRPGDAHYCERGECQCAECRQYEEVLRAYERGGKRP